jgi:V/A-type H+-transporting ATPase subunit C
LKKAKYVPFGPEPILAYVLTREGEQTTVRTVMNGRFAGVSPEDIRERLRESYV